MSISLKAFAKINLGLDVVRKREDGYHEVRMVMQTISLFDKIELSMEAKPGIRVSTNLSFLPNNENNLVYKAANLLMEEFKITSGICIDLQKHIPVAAGLAGGSSDAAAVLVGVNKMFSLGLSMQDLMERGVKIGADVPYCVLRGTALSEGIGEVLTPLPPMMDCYALIAKPGISVSTKFVYENLRANELKEHPDIDGMVKAIENKDFEGVTNRMGNVLETVTTVHYPIINEIKDYMKSHGAVNAMMSGSGPTVFGIFRSEATAKKVCVELHKKGMARQAFVTRMVNRK